VRGDRRKVALQEFVEDFLEELGDEAPLDPAHPEDIRDRLTISIPGSLAVSASPPYLKNILRDLLRNAVLYSPKDSPITVKATRIQQGAAVQIDVADQGYGIRTKEADRVFAPFQRARQPQIIGEFGYGLSLYLAKSEIEAMGGRIWYESEENVGSTFSIKLPAWRDVSDDDA
jgi:signal transduction histidine kinase